MCLGNLNGHVGRHIDGDDEGNGIDQINLEGRMVVVFCLWKELCQIRSLREEKRKVTPRMGENETEIYSMFIKIITLTAYTKFEGDHWGDSTCISCSRNRL